MTTVNANKEVSAMLDKYVKMERELAEVIVALRALQAAIAGDSVTTRLSVDVAQAMYKARAVLNRHPQPGQQEKP